MTMATAAIRVLALLTVSSVALGGNILKVPGKYPSIGAAVAAANDGDTVQVSAGIYQGPDNCNIDLAGKAIRIEGIDGPEKCIIDCHHQGRGFSFTHHETRETVLHGLTIRGGQVEGGGGAIYCSGASPTIENCLISDNQALMGNGFGQGGGISLDGHCSPTFTECTIRDNTAVQGAGLDAWGHCEPILERCLISGNQVSFAGGGFEMVQSSSLTLTNCVVRDNQAKKGAGQALWPTSSATITSCTIAGNTASQIGGGIQCIGNAGLTIRNGIVWANEPDGIDGSAVASHSNIQGGCAGVSNVTASPLFAQPAQGDYRLLEGSPCLDSGDLPSSPAVDIAGTSRPQGIGVDRGAYEGKERGNQAPEILRFDATPSSVVLPGKISFQIDAQDDTGIAAYSIDFGDGNPPAVAASGRCDYTYKEAGDYQVRCTVTDDGGVTVTSLPLPVKIWAFVLPGGYNTIQQAIDAAEEGQVITLPDRTYTGSGNKNLNFHGKHITLQSEGGPDGCIIDCEGWGRGLRFDNGEGTDAVVSGLTIVNGHVGAKGGGIYCHGTSPTITDVKILNCAAVSACGSGGGIACVGDASPTFENCVIAGNYSGTSGGGIDIHGSPTFQSCTIEGNTAVFSGGGASAWFSSPVFRECRITDNEADDFGGGLQLNAHCHATIENCVVSGNSSVEAGGGVFSCGDMVNHNTLTMMNCVLRDNSVTDGTGEGGGLFSIATAANLVCCTIVGNGAGLQGGGICAALLSSVDTRNCIVWGNTPGAVELVTPATLTVTHSDVQGGHAGSGNIDAKPHFVDAASGDYRLEEGSPCVDAGTDQGAPKRDIAGSSRPQGSGPDMGAFEGAVEAAVGSTNSTSTSAKKLAQPGGEETATYRDRLMPCVADHGRWAGYEVGAQAIYRCETETLAGDRYEDKITVTLAEAGEEAPTLLVEFETKLDGELVGRSTHKISPGEGSNAHADVSTKPRENQVLKVAGQKIECEVLDVVIKDSSALTQRTDWTSKDIPGTLVKAEISVSGEVAFTSRVDLESHRQ